MTLFSYVDVLVAQIVRVYYRKHPSAFPAQSRRLSLEELRKFKILQDAEEYLLDRRVDALLRRSLKKQLAFFRRRLNINLDVLKPFEDRIIETVQRRHILVHNGGVINRAYLDRVPPELATEYGMVLGENAKVDDQYLRRAIDRIHLLGTVLLQRCWRQWFKADVPAADTAMNDAIYGAICEERYKLACNLGEFARTLSFTTDADQRNMLLNLAQAYKWDGDVQTALGVVKSADWSSCGIRFRLGLLAIHDQNDEFFRLLPLAVAAREIKAEEVADWPIFKQIRADSRFVSELQRLFPEPECIPPKPRDDDRAADPGVSRKSVAAVRARAGRRRDSRGNPRPGG